MSAPRIIAADNLLDAWRDAAQYLLANGSQAQNLILSIANRLLKNPLRAIAQGRHLPRSS
jgi:hypothetical protein